MPESSPLNQFERPFVFDGPAAKSLYFSITAIQSRMKIAQPDALALEYTKTMMAFLLFNPQPKAIAMVGLGGGSMAKFCYRHLPGSSIQVVEVNPHVIALRKEFQIPPDDERFSVIQGDGAWFIRRPPQRFDVLLLDGFDSQGLPARLSSQRFYDNCRAALQPNGIMVANLEYGHQHHDVYLDRIRKTFGESVFTVVDDDCSNSIAFACNGDLLHRQRPGVLRCPPGLGQDAWEQLMPNCARVLSRLKPARA